MQPAEPAPLARLSFDAATLVAEHPPRLRNRNKEVVHRIAAGGSAPAGTVVYTRWWEMPLPASMDRRRTTAVAGREDVYDYVPLDGDGVGGAVEWHVNFADPELFTAYGTGLFAQDEMQVAEHPVLGSLREALLARREPARTIEGRVATPVLVRGVERRVRVATDADAAERRPDGLYGNRFAAAGEEAVRRAVTRIDPPTITNLIAIAAPQGGRGAYQRVEIRSILATAYTGFRAAVLESRQTPGDDVKTVVHTGFWGCGAFGGDRVLMALLQIFAAHLAGVTRLVFHTFDRNGTDALAEAREIFDSDISPTGDAARGGRRAGFLGSLLRRSAAKAGPAGVSEAVTLITLMRFRWGTSDGN